MEPNHRMSNSKRHAMNLPIATFVHGNLNPGVSARTRENAHAIGPRRPILQRHAPSQHVHRVLRNMALQLGLIHAFNFERRVHQGVRQFPVVGEQEDTLCVVVEPSYGNDAYADAPNQIADRVTSLGIGERCDEAARFVQDNRNPILEVSNLACHAHMVTLGLHVNDRVFNRAAIDGDLARAHQLFGFAA